MVLDISSILAQLKKAGKQFTSKPIPATKLKNYIINTIKETIFSTGILEKLEQLVLIIFQKKNNASNNVNNEQNELGEIEGKLSKLPDLYLDNITDKETLNEKTRNLVARSQFLKQKIATAL